MISLLIEHFETFFSFKKRISSRAQNSLFGIERLCALEIENKLFILRLVMVLRVFRIVQEITEESASMALSFVVIAKQFYDRNS